MKEGKTMTHYIELHKAKKIYSIVRNLMTMVEKLGLSTPIKTSIKTELNVIVQFLSLKQLKEIQDDGKGNLRYHTPEEEPKESGERRDVSKVS